MPKVAAPPRLSAPWLTGILRTAGVLADDARVAGFKTSSVEGGNLSRTERLILEYDVQTDTAPASVILKTPAAKPSTRQVAAAMNLYAREVFFYRDLAPGLTMRVPRCYFTYHDGDTGAFMLLIEDIADGAVHDQDEACPVEDAGLAMTHAAALHAAYWNSPRLHELEWLNHLGPRDLDVWQAMYCDAWAAFSGRDEVILDPGLRAIGDELGSSRLRSWIDVSVLPLTLTHADYHLTNMLFSTDCQGARRMATVDWQMTMHAPAMIDISYFIGRMPRDDRRAQERDLVRTYHQALCDGGVQAYEWDQCWLDYQRCTWFGVLSAVVASATTALTAEEAHRYSAKVNRYLEQARDHDATRFLDGW